nr:hypothetical protein [Tanacetum cinerariifolium]
QIDSSGAQSFVSQLKVRKNTVSSPHSMNPRPTPALEALFWYKLSAMCHTKDCGPSRGLYLYRVSLKYRCAPIPNEDSDPLMEEIDLYFNLDDPMPPGIEEDDDDSERDILILEELLDNYSLSLPTNESYHLIFLHLIVLLQNHQMVIQEL